MNIKTTAKLRSIRKKTTRVVVALLPPSPCGLTKACAYCTVQTQRYIAIIFLPTYP